jgi:hypothetical protein
MKRFSWYILIGIAFCNFSCARYDCLIGAGNQAKEIRNIGTFKQIEIYDYFNVYLKQDTIDMIVVEAGENELVNISTKVNNGILTIKDSNTCRFVKGYSENNLYISIDTLEQVFIYDGVNLFTSDTLKQENILIRFLSDIGSCNLLLNCRNLRFEVWYSSGDYTLKGKSGICYLSTHELSVVYAQELEAGQYCVYNNSMGSSFVKTSGILEVFIKNSGDVHYLGEPSEILLREDTGAGSLIKDE